MVLSELPADESLAYAPSGSPRPTPDPDDPSLAADEALRPLEGREGYNDGRSLRRPT